MSQSRATGQCQLTSILCIQTARGIQNTAKGFCQRSSRISCQRRCEAAQRDRSHAKRDMYSKLKIPEEKINRCRAYDNLQLCSGAGDVTLQVARCLSHQDIILDYRMTVRFILGIGLTHIVACPIVGLFVKPTGWSSEPR
jgi:hypothetical protein